MTTVHDADQLRSLVQSFSSDPSKVGRSLRELAKVDEEGLFQTAVPVLREADSSQGFRYLLALLLSRNRSLLEKVVCNPALFSMQEAAHLAELLSRLDPQFEKRLALVGAAERTREITDSRARADHVEAMWGNRSDAAKRFFLAAAADCNNRVAANALVGLYRGDDLRSITMLSEMAAHPDRRFQASAAWAMGETRDVRFLPVLRPMISEPARVGRNAALAIDLIEHTHAGELN